MVAPGHMKTRQTTDRSDGPHVAEVIRLHRVIAAWTAGEAANTADSFSRFAGRLAPGFMIVNRGAVAGVAAVFIVLVGGIVTTSLALARESLQRSLAEQRQQEAKDARDGEAEARAEAQERQQEAE